MILLFQDVQGGPPHPADAASYWEAIGEPTFPVTVDPSGAMLEATPWEGSPLPGKCVLGPDMVLLDCYTGDEDGDAFTIMAADWAAR
jgi:hypothetical protein